MAQKYQRELRSSVRLLRRAVLRERLGEYAWTQSHRVGLALRAVLDHDDLSESAKAYLLLAKENLSTKESACYTAKRSFDRELDSLASLLGVAK